jgi:predicted ferric reductase
MAMTATIPPLQRRRATTPATVARIVLGAAVLTNLALVEALFLAHGIGENSVLVVANFVGLHAALVLMVQLVLVARLPWLDRRIGMDRLTLWHRWTGFALLWTVLTHAALVVLGYMVLDDESAWRAGLALVLDVPSLLGMLAATLLVVVGATSLRAARRRLSYETWHALHLLPYLVVGLGILHQLLDGTTFPAALTAASMYWWVLWAVVVVALLVGRLGLPLWRNARHRFRVAAVVAESDDVVSIHVTGRHLDRLPARAGQFFIWRFPGHHRWWQANPFSLSAAPDGHSLRLTVKASGPASAALRHLPVGTRVFAEGPYGAFTSAQRTRDAALLIAGGVGVTPIRALLEEATGPTTVLYRVRTGAEAVLLPELENLARRRGARLHVLAGRTAAGSPFTPEALLGGVPDILDRDVFVCGPPGMTAAVLRSLRALGVPRQQIHAERFGLA